jgi:two-component system phosphate regulon sensor histidine kinase PhoR
MKRYVKRLSFVGALVIMLTLVSGCIFVFNNVQQKTVRDNLTALIHTADVFIQNTPDDIKALTEKIASGGNRLRVTFLDNAGKVLSDSMADADTMESHAGRPEVIKAMAGETGTDVRLSATTGLQTIYTAKRVGDGLILRLSYPVSTTREFLWLLLPVVAILVLALIAAVPLFASRLSKKVTHPLILINNMLMDKGGESLLGEDTDRAEPEVRPILSNISYLIEKLKYDFEEVQKTQRLRTDFVANASHELKSPLTSIKGFAELLAGDMVPDTEKQKVYLKRIVSESDRLLNIINDILRLSKAESKVMEKAELVKLQPMAKDVAQALEPLARTRGISITLDGTGVVTANPRDIWELTYNLVDNAIRYGKQGGHVMIHLGDYFLSVEDDGIGIEEEHLTRIFERFYRIDKSHSRQTGGTGLGLSIVKHIAQNYGAMVQVKSRPGEGSTFSVQFPCDVASDHSIEQ